MLLTSTVGVIKHEAMHEKFLRFEKLADTTLWKGSTKHMYSLLLDIFCRIKNIK